MFVKLFGTILDSSIWTQDPETRVVWITMLAMADADGFVWASVDGLARRANVPLPACQRALKMFLAPDRKSRTDPHDGRRVEAADGGWFLLNYQKYRELRTHRQIVDAARQARHRKSSVTTVTERDSSVTGVTSHDVTVEAEAEADAEAKNKSKALVALKRDDLPPATNGGKANGKHPKALPAIIESLQTLGTDTASRLTKDAFRRVMVEITFAYWAKRLGHEHSLLDDKRRRVISARLVENGDNLSELLYAVDGALRDDWVMGRDPKSTKRYDGIETLFQDRAHVEKYAGAVAQYRQGVTHPMALKYAGETAHA